MSSTHAQPCFEIHIHNFYEQVGRMIIPFSKLRCKNERTLACTKLQCVQINIPNRCTGLSWILGSLPSPAPAPPPHTGNKAAFVQFVSPPGVKIPRGMPLTLGSLPSPPRGEDTLAWGACPPPPEHLTKLNAERKKNNEKHTLVLFW